MTDLFVPAMVVLVVLTAIGQAFRLAQGWHREIGQLQEQARMRALAAREQQVAEWREACRRYSIDRYEGPHPQLALLRFLFFNRE